MAEDAAAMTRGPDILRFPEIDSTMFEAERQIRAGRTQPFVVVAESQTQGHGRSRDRTWVSPEGNLYWTLAMPKAEVWPKDFGLSFATGLATLDALVACGLAPERLNVKWPNDALFERRKISGALITNPVLAVGERPVSFLLVGIGINVASHPVADPFFAATSMRAAGIDAGVPDVCAALTRAFSTRFDAWRRGGFAAFRDEYRTRMYACGERIRVARDRDRTIFVEGINRGIDATGNLLLDTGERLETINAGDVLAPM